MLYFMNLKTFHLTIVDHANFRLDSTAHMCLLVRLVFARVRYGSAM